MLIRVKYVDERFDMVRPEILDRLLASGKVREFERHDGWVMPSTATLRSKDKIGYTGPDRRMRRVEDHRSAL